MRGWECIEIHCSHIFWAESFNVVFKKVPFLAITLFYFPHKKTQLVKDRSENRQMPTAFIDLIVSQRLSVVPWCSLWRGCWAWRAWRGCAGGPTSPQGTSCTSYTLHNAVKYNPIATRDVKELGRFEQPRRIFWKSSLSTIGLCLCFCSMCPFLSI